MSANIDYLIVAGGGGTPKDYSSGAGGGAVLTGTDAVNTGDLTVTVGAGGTGGNTTSATNGSNSVFNGHTALGGGKGVTLNTAGVSGGSGGGGGGKTSSGTNSGGTAGTGGNAGGSGTLGTPSGNNFPTGGGGGSGAVGGDGTLAISGSGGAGTSSSISGSSVTYGGGGGGGGYSQIPTVAGSGGSGGGGNGGSGNGGSGTAGTANTGGGAGGGAGNQGPGANGGSGIVIITYETSDFGTCTGGTITTNGSKTVHTFTSSGTFHVDASTNATVTPSALTISSSINAPTIISSPIITPSTLDITTTLVTPTYIGEILTITPSSLDVNVSIQNPIVVIDTTINPNPLTISSSINAPIIIIDCTTNPSVLNILADIISPASVDETLTVLVSPLTVTANIQPVDIRIDAFVSPSTLTVLAAMQNPFEESDVTFLASVLNVISTIHSPVVNIVVTYSAYAQKIVSYNPLIFVTNTSPARLVKVNVTVPTAPTWAVYLLSEIDYAKDVFVNTTSGYLYVIGANGLILKAPLSDLNNHTIIDVSDTDELVTISGLPDIGTVFVGTDNASGELYTLDERSTQNIETDFQVLSNRTAILNSTFNSIQAEMINTEFTVLSQNKHYIHTDFKCLTDVLNNITSIPQTGFRVFIDNTEVIDPDLSLDSIQITHTIDTESVAYFVLNRRHDDMNRNLNGDMIDISSSNAIRIEINGYVEFDGVITDLDCQYDKGTEQVSITANQLQPNYQFNNITISLPSVNKHLGIYDVLIQNPKITRPFVDDRIIIVGDNDEYWTNTDTWSLHLSDARVFATYQIAYDYIVIEKALNNETGTTFASRNPVVGYPSKSPKKYMGILVNLGDLKTQDIKRYTDLSSGETNAIKIQNGSFHPLQNWTYFWSCIVEKIRVPAVATTDVTIDPYASPLDSPFLSLNDSGNIVIPSIFNTTQNKISNAIFNITQDVGSGLPNDAIYFRYIGTSLSPVSANLFNLKNAYYSYQRRYNDIISPLGFYFVGSAPYKEINVRNGQFVTKYHWEDRADGWYSIKDAGYNFLDYAKKVADLEYEKLKNINGDILPEVRCSMSLSIDGYYYYGMKLLSRLNVDNTTQVDIFKNNNGFPTSIKSITINSSDMLVSLQTDNLKSTLELDIINEAFPDEEDYLEPEVVLFQAQKTDMATRLKVN